MSYNLVRRGVLRTYRNSIKLMQRSLRVSSGLTMLRPIASDSSHNSSSFSSKFMSMYLLGLSVTTCVSLLCNHEGIVSCEDASKVKVEEVRSQSIEKSYSFKLFLKELRMFLRQDQINVDDDDCQDRGKPWNSYHKTDVYPQVRQYDI